MWISVTMQRSTRRVFLSKRYRLNLVAAPVTTAPSYAFPPEDNMYMHLGVTKLCMLSRGYSYVQPFYPRLQHALVAKQQHVGLRRECKAGKLQETMRVAHTHCCCNA